MPTSQHEVENLSVQVNKLERQVRFLKRSFALLVGVMLTAFIFGQAAPLQPQPTTTKVLEAEKFVLKDSKGRIRGEWEVEDFPACEWNRVILRMRNSEGKVAVVLQNPSWGDAQLLLFDKPTTTTSWENLQLVLNPPLVTEAPPLLCSLGVDLDGAGRDTLRESHASLSATWLSLGGDDIKKELSIGSSRIDMFGPKGFLSLTNQDGPNVYMRSEDRKTGGDWSVSDSGMTFAALADKKPRSFWEAGPDANRIGLYDTSGKLRAVLGSTDLSNVATGESRSRKESSIVLFGEDGKVVFSAP